jgi:hypothetical protein
LQHPQFQGAATLRRAAFALLSVLAIPSLAPPASAKPVEFFQVDGVSHVESVPAFEDHAGYEIGERPVPFADMIANLRDLAARSDRISVETIGYSHERRPILTSDEYRLSPGERSYVFHGAGLPVPITIVLILAS